MIPWSSAGRAPCANCLVALASLILAGCAAGAGGSPDAPAPSDPDRVAFAPELGLDLEARERTATGLYVQDLTEGEGFTAKRTSLVKLHYVGYLPDGSIFDTSSGGEPLQVRLGANEVIRGWNQGIPGMKRGGIRRLVVRPSLAYRSQSRGRIPPNSTLVFDVQLLDVR